MNTFCPECGTKLKKEAHFCPECGFEIENTQSSQPTQTKPLREPKTQEPKKQVSQERIQERKAKNSDETVSFNLPLKPIILLLVICGILYGGYYLYTNYLQKSDTQTEQTQNEKSEENTEQEKTGNETNKESEKKNESVQNINYFEGVKVSSISIESLYDFSKAIDSGNNPLVIRFKDKNGEEKTYETGYNSYDSILKAQDTHNFSTTEGLLGEVCSRQTFSAYSQYCTVSKIVSHNTLEWYMQENYFGSRNPETQKELGIYGKKSPELKCIFETNVETKTTKFKKCIDEMNYFAMSDETKQSLQEIAEQLKNTQNKTTQNTSSDTTSTKFRVITDKAYFYDSADTPNSNSSYLIRGDYVEVSPAKSGNTKYFVHFTNSAGIITTGYIRKADLQSISEEEIANEGEQDKKNKTFIRSHYKDMKDKKFHTAYANYLYPKAKNVNDFANWYTDTYNIELGDIQKIGYNDYRFRVVVSSYNSINTYETSMKIGKVDGKLRILGYTSTSISSKKSFHNNKNNTTKKISTKASNKITPEHCFEFGDSKKVIVKYNPSGTGCGSDIVIPNGVTIIQSFAFKDGGIKSVKISNSVNLILDQAFADNNISYLDLGSSIEYIGIGAFAGNKLTSVYIPNSVKNLEVQAFIQNSISHVEIPSSLEVVKKYGKDKVEQNGIYAFDKNVKIKVR